MACVASCPQCEHELLVPSEADGEAWAKCPECRAFFQVREATAHDVPALLLVEAGEPELAESDENDIAQQSTEASGDFAPAANWKDSAKELDASDADNLDLDLDDLGDEPKTGDDLEAAAQRIDEWFRSAKTLPDAPAVPEAPTDEAAASSEETDDRGDDVAPKSEARTNATIELGADDDDDLAASADFDLDDALQAPEKPAAWDDSERMKDLLADIEMPSADEFVSAVAREDEAVDLEPATTDERPTINMFADDAAPEIKKSKDRAPRRKRSLVMVTAAGLFGLAAGYYALLWLRGPSIDFLHVAQYLPPAALPSSFQPKPIVPAAPPATEVVEAEPTEPQELEPATEQPMEGALAETTPAEMTDESAEVQAGYTETQQSPETAAPVVGDRYATTTSETDATATEEPATTDLTAEKPVAADISAADSTATDQATSETTATDLGVTEPAATKSAETESDATEPATLDAPAADPLFGETETVEATEILEPVKIDNAPLFSADDLRSALETATKAQPQLVTGNFADGKDVQRAKGFGFSMLADLAQKATFVDEAAKRDAAQLDQEADELFRKTLADVHTRGEVAQILPKWMASPNRKHGGVFFAGSVASQENAGSVIECKVELDGGQTLTILAPSTAATESLESAKLMAIVGWIVDKPAEQVSGYTGSAPQAIWAGKIIPLE
ncbi:MAG: hypothetical protein L0228_19350 [Planctomycetes bacterium]|nr:hypothetical protein [Planctomycetota bacterium]